MDRISPTQRPNGQAIGYQSWNDLLFLHWSVPVSTLEILLPKGLKVDLFEGKAYVGLVPFTMKGVRPMWAPKWSAFEFLETNVRLYVHHKGRPGVFFLSLEAASRIAVKIAQTLWCLPYFFAEMGIEKEGQEVLYTSRRVGTSNPALKIKYRIGEPLGPSIPGSLEHFLLERYLLFTEKKGQLLYGQVHHTPYPAQSAEIIEIKEELLAASKVPVNGLPELAHYSKGVDVEIFPLRPA